jgi:hypothetical protein
MAKCQSKTLNGQQCKSHAQAGSVFCFFHDPGSRDQRREAQRKGGGRREPHASIPSPPFDFDFSSPQGVARAITWAVNRLLQGGLDTKLANAIGYLGDCALRAHSAGAVAERLAALERLQHAEVSRPAEYEAVPVVFEEKDAESSSFGMEEKGLP